jgi:hypothetical protein
MSSEESTTKHQCQTVSYKRKRMNSQTSVKEAVQIQTCNRFESLSEPPCVKSQNGTPTNFKTSDTSKREPKPPPIYIYGVNNLKAMLDNFTMVTDGNHAKHTRNIQKTNPTCKRRKNHTPHVPDKGGKSVQNSNPRSASLHTNV